MNRRNWGSKVIGASAALCLASSCATTQVATIPSVESQELEPEPGCDFKSAPGREFVFAATEDEGRIRYGDYAGFLASLERGEMSISYGDYVGLRGKIADEPRGYKDGQETPHRDTLVRMMYPALLEDCRTLFVAAGAPHNPANHDRIARSAKIFFLDDLEAAQSMVGETIYLDLVRDAPALASTAPDETPQLRHLAPLSILGVETLAYEHLPGALSLVVKDSDGNRALLKPGEHILTETPVPDNWDSEVVDRIQQQQVSIGMTAEQVRLSWGEPTSINRSTGRAGVREQWVYGGGDYLYLGGGLVESMQTSR